jgi:hypothetical protein
VGLLREREDGPWLLTSAVVIGGGGPVRWTVDVRGRQYGSDSPTGHWDDAPNATLYPDPQLWAATVGRSATTASAAA